MIGRIQNVLYRVKEKALPSPIPAWIRVAQREIGVREIRGGENPRIIEYHQTTTLRATEDEVPWCSAFVNWVCNQCGLERTHSAAARSWLSLPGRLPGFRKYAIVIMRRGNSTWQGHVGFAISDNGDTITVLGGNQSDSVCYAKCSKASVLGYRWPGPAKTANEVHRLA